LQIGLDEGATLLTGGRYLQLLTLALLLLLLLFLLLLSADWPG
jgi:hypothetical protein